MAGPAATEGVVQAQTIANLAAQHIQLQQQLAEVQQTMAALTVAAQLEQRLADFDAHMAAGKLLFWLVEITALGQVAASGFKVSLEHSGRACKLSSVRQATLSWISGKTDQRLPTPDPWLLPYQQLELLWAGQVSLARSSRYLKQHAACMLPGGNHWANCCNVHPAGSFLKAAECAAELQHAAQADEWGQTGTLQQAQAECSQALHQASPCCCGCLLRACTQLWGCPVANEFSFDVTICLPRPLLVLTTLLGAFRHCASDWNQQCQSTPSSCRSSPAVWVEHMEPAMRSGEPLK